MRRLDGTTEMIVDPRSQAYGYRGLEILGRMQELELGTPVIETAVRYVLRD
jgi:hypothetical protein